MQTAKCFLGVGVSTQEWFYNYEILMLPLECPMDFWLKVFKMDANRMVTLVHGIRGIGIEARLHGWKIYNAVLRSLVYTQTSVMVHGASRKYVNI